jgi:prephenate dehydrogenase
VLEKIAIFGVGLIGGSFALALKKAGMVRQVVGVGRTRAVLERAREIGIIDRAANSVAEAVDGADLILIATPVAQTGAILAAIAPLLQAQTVVTDAGSTKSDVVATARAVLGDRIGQFVPGHPIAGREANGPDAALADLYVGKKVVLTPLPENSAATVDIVAWSTRSTTRRMRICCSSMRRVASGISPGSPARRRKCGATSRWPTAPRCSRKSTPTRRRSND